MKKLILLTFITVSNLFAAWGNKVPLEDRGPMECNVFSYLFITFLLWVAYEGLKVIYSLLKEFYYFLKDKYKEYKNKKGE